MFTIGRRREEQRWLPVLNVSGQAIPAYAILLVTGIDADTGLLRVTAPDADGIDAAHLLANGATLIPADGMGQGTQDWPAIVRVGSGAGMRSPTMLLSDAVPTYGTRAGSWAIVSHQPGFARLGDLAGDDAALVAPACCIGEPPPGCCPDLDCAPLCATVTGLQVWNVDGPVWTVSTLSVTGRAHSPFGTPSAYVAMVSTELLSPYRFITVGLAVGFGCIAGTPDSLTLQVTLKATGVHATLPSRNINGLFVVSDSSECDLSEFETPSPVSFASGGGGSGLTALVGEYRITASACAYPECYPPSATCALAGVPDYCCDDGADWFCAPAELPSSLTGACIDDGFANLIPVGTPCTIRRQGTAVINGIALVATFWFDAAPSTPAFLACDGTVYSAHYAIDGNPLTAAVLGPFAPQAVGSVTTIHSCDPLDIEITFAPGGASTPYRSISGVKVRLTE